MWYYQLLLKQLKIVQQSSRVIDGTLVFFRYNDQLVEVRKDLKSCKSKMESQSKQVQEYSNRLDEYDKKFEREFQKFQTLLTVSYRSLYRHILPHTS